MIVVTGEILFDVFPDYRRPGGAPFNFAVHLMRMGFPVRFFSRIGQDEEGRELEILLEKYGLLSDYIQKDPEKKTGTVFVKLDEKGIPEFNISEDAAYDMLEYDHTLFNEKTDLIYIGTLIQRTPGGHETVQKILDEKDENVPVMLDINLRPGCYSKKVILDSLHHSDILKINDTELETLKRYFAFYYNDTKFVRFLMNEFSLDLLSLTRGSQGSSLYSAHGEFHAEKPDNVKVIDTVGAGDAYAAVIAAGYLNGWDEAEILDVAAMFASRICGVEGAFPDDDSIYEDLIFM